MKNKLTLLLVFLGLAAITAVAADVNGQWIAQVPGRGGQLSETTFQFKADGTKLTGSITTQRGESAISDGKIEGDNISFTQTLEFGGNSFKFLYEGKVSGSEIKMTRKREGGQGQAQEFVAKRKPS
jgi:hypothetical protein